VLTDTTIQTAVQHRHSPTDTGSVTILAGGIMILAAKLELGGATEGVSLTCERFT